MNDWLNVFFHGNSCVTQRYIFERELYSLREMGSVQFYSFCLSRTYISNETEWFSTNCKFLRHQSLYSALHQCGELRGKFLHKMQGFLILHAPLWLPQICSITHQQTPVPFLSHIWVLRNLSREVASKEGKEITFLRSMIWSKTESLTSVSSRLGQGKHKKLLATQHLALVRENEQNMSRRIYPPQKKKNRDSSVLLKVTHLH